MTVKIDLSRIIKTKNNFNNLILKKFFIFCCTNKVSKKMSVTVHPLTNQPTVAYSELKEKKKFVKLKVKLPTNPVASDKARIVCMSDTHSLTPHLKFDIPDGDIFIHAGDFTKCGHIKEVQEFNNWLGTLPHKHKIVIAGNHELSFDSSFKHPFERETEMPCLGILRHKISEAYDAIKLNVKSQLKNCTYLEDQLVEIYGLRIYGTPWQPEFMGWAFNVPRGEECLKKWEKIPNDVDILVTHTPPLGHGDRACSGVRAGCVELLTTVQERVKPKYHVFGHIHEDYGVSTDGKTIFINASTCDINYIPNNQPIVFDISLPPGQTKN